MNSKLSINGNISANKYTGNGFVAYNGYNPIDSAKKDHLHLWVDSNNTYLDSGGGNPFLLRGTTTTSGTSDYTSQTYGNIIVANYMDPSASVTIGNSGSSSLLTVNGNITSTSIIKAVSFNATSDYRIKQDILTLSGTYVVDKLRPVEYFNTLLNRMDVGIVAHELQEIYPFLVTGEKDGENYQSVNYTGLIGILIREIQELKKRVAVLEDAK
jgi:hypothetical protein